MAQDAAFSSRRASARARPSAAADRGGAEVAIASAMGLGFFNVWLPESFIAQIPVFGKKMPTSEAVREPIGMALV
jgi:hypothetical protein